MSPVLDNIDLFVDGFLTSLEIILWALAGTLPLGVLIAACRVSPIPPLRAFGTFWVTTFRNTPLTVVLVFCAFGLPELGINRSFFFFGVLGLVLYTSAFVCEAVRSGINSVPAGQAEAARSIGLNFTQGLRYVVLPQALRTVVPPLGSVVIAMMKNSAVVGAFGVGGDLWSTGQRLTSALGYETFPIFVGGVAVGYLIITLTAGALLQVLERRVAIAR
ncbi:amino acid ABC transporter permease [Blastococcus sp. MG754426]|uniref:amino acid ABC transporter permease n=1 Tax=unclassified Blastococcus TaxID=2619396 RepID=UPI001EF034BE|nr:MULTISPECIES: amino acid ABC transporter permease [unclassified Blastococcus]MCF6507500.1 amino acid ABC transporter permease [Blastococcus sp. MG754426]MCF6512869.1 amino acid ABC transporter permease [Blastococcus sp. MG754427]MCF6733599.1 amino acid ABC transporter permease [Blastococcus sp. KM273129]